MSAVTTASGLVYEEIIVGDGEVATAGHHVTVHYTGWLTDGKKFDSSKDRDDPFQFGLGQGQGAGAADALPGGGDEHDLAVQPPAHAACLRGRQAGPTGSKLL